MRCLLLLLAGSLSAQVLLIEGESAFVVRPGASVDLRVVLSAASLGGNVAGVNVRFVGPDRRTIATVATDAAGKAAASYTVPERAAYFSVDAVAEAGDGAVASFALSVGSFAPPTTAEAIKAEVRRTLLRNAADGSNLQLVGPYWLEAGTLIRPARWSKDKEAGGLWRAEVGSWFFWVDDGPARSWAKPTRYYLVPGGDVSQARITGEQWWPLVRPVQSDWQSVGRATSFAGDLLPITSGSFGTGDQCAVLLANSGQPGANLSFNGFEAFVRRQGLTRVYNEPSLATNCRRTYLMVSAAGDRDGILLDRWMSWEELSRLLPASGELIAVVESNQSGMAAKWWNGGTFISSTDDLRIGYMQPLRGGYVVRGLLPALERSSGNFEAAFAETQRGELTVSSARPQLQRVAAGGPRRMPLDDVEFSNTGGWRWIPFARPLLSPVVSVSDPLVAQAHISGNGVLVRALAEGRADLLVTAVDGANVLNGLATIRVGLGSSTVRTCLVVAGQTQCLGQLQRNIPAAEDEVGGHAFLDVQDEAIASIDAKLYTYNRGERNIPISVRGLKAGRTWLKLRSHDGNVMSDIPVQVADLPATIAGSLPQACPDAATFRATFAVSGGDQTLFEPFGGAWWGTGITLVFRKTAPDRFEIRSSGATEGQFFSMAGTLAADCSFTGSGQGVAGLKITTAQVRGRIAPRAGVFDTMTLDYAIGVDGVFGSPIEYRGTGLLLAGCAYQVRAAEALTATGGLFPVAVASPALCPWTASVGSGAAEVVAGQLGFGPGVLWLQVPENPGLQRTVRLTVAGQPVELIQPAASQGAPLLQAVLHPGRVDTVFTPGAPAILLGSNLLSVPALFYSPGYIVTRLSSSTRQGVAAITNGASKPVLVQVERSAPAILTTNGSVVVSGIDPLLPVWVEVDGIEQPVVVRSSGDGFHELLFRDPLVEWAGKPILVRQGGRASQRGVFVM